jgi:histone-lysine N-methyltransferase SETMAR
MKHGSITLYRRPKDSQLYGIIQLLLGRRSFKVTPSAGKAMATVFWEPEGVILEDIMPRGQTINSDLYIQTLKKLQKRLRRVRPHKNVAEILLQHDNARPHTSLKTGSNHKTRMDCSPYPPYSPDHAPLDFHLFWSPQKCRPWEKVWE